ncbi:alpha/beta fold hydrolase [Caldichromatium japonicum]|uniref:Alpha/beta fold hydrolase n=1 Tax=Caldichromatium japonicum TaxID=2699430 RepID=A0A6G7VFQ2_9GAMM|nr:alpha/beta fold hydrolase BchO [Caldichromatium japonicum]QIK38695.1 alpha/beta fold hydrolase [Caldichromatium japonicum]
MANPDRPDWEQAGRDWPNRSASAFISVGGVRWHVQRLGQGPCLLLLHGTGASTHSWRDLAPLLAKVFTIIAPDLPGHGFTTAPSPTQMTLPGMAALVGALLKALAVQPDLVLGHSAGAAIAIQARLDNHLAPRGIISLNGALLPWRGLPGHLFTPAAKLFATNSLVARWFAWRARDRRVIERLIASTGSTLDARGAELYQRLIQHPAHVWAALSMMANWDLGLMEQGLPRLDTPLFLIVGLNDTTVSPREARRVRTSCRPDAELFELPGLGHLAHEEQPQAVAALVKRIAAQLELTRTNS